MREEYRSYLLRLWRVRGDGQTWRAMLENVETGERYGFATLEALAAFLRRMDEHEAGAQPEDGAPGGADD